MSGTMLDAMRAAGIGPAKDLVLAADGKVRRYRVEGDKAGSNNGWYVAYDGTTQGGAFGSWRTGESHTWHESTTRPQTPAERAEQQRLIKVAQAARLAELASVQAAARERAAKLWKTAHPATDVHAYLKRKRIGAYGIRQLRDSLVIAARDVHGQLHTLQFIGIDGSKRFLTGGRIAGCYFAIGRPAGSLLVCEGLATGSTLYKATGKAVAVAFNCGNLLAVAKALRGKFPALRLIVCADNDADTPGNPGLTHATAAARAVGGFVAVPHFAGRSE